MAEKNSLWKNIRKKAEQNRRTGNKPKEPTKEMLDQERKIKAQYAVGGYLGGEDDDVFKSSQNQGSTVGKVAQDWYSNWVQNPEFAERLNRNFPSHAGDLEKKIYGTKEARERASAANLKNINKVIPGIVSDIYDTQFLYNTNPEINTGLLSSYKSRLEDPKSIKALERNLSTNPQGFTDEQGRIVITNQANTQYGPQSVGVHELTHKVSERDKTLDKLFKGKFQTPAQDRIDANYDKDEMYPFLMQMRFDNKFQPGEEITPERLKQIKDSGYQNHLFKYYNDDEISKYLNTLASNQTQAPMQYAAQGGKLYAEGDSIDPPSGTKYIPPTRQDSLMLYNNALDKIRFYSSNPDYRKTSSKTNFKDPKVRKNLIWDAFQVDPIVRSPLVEEIAFNAASNQDALNSGVKPSKPMSADEKRKMQKQVGVKKFGKVAGTNLTSLGDVVSGQPDVYYNPLAPPIYLHPNISPQGSEAYISQRLNDLSDIPNYDPLAVAPWDTLNEKQKEERVKKYGTSGTPLASASTRVTKPSIDKLQSKQYTSSNQQPGLVGNIEEISPVKTMSADPEGHYRITRPSTYGEPNYQVWTSGNKWKDVSKEEFDKISSEKYLTEYAQGGKLYPDGGRIPPGWIPLTAELAKGRYSGSLKDMYYNPNGEGPGNSAITYFKPPKPSINKLQSKQYSNSSSNQQPGIVGNVENISPLEINMDKFYEGQYEKYRRSPYEDPMYRVQLPGQQMQIVPESEFKKLNEQYALKDLEQKAQGGRLYAEGGDGEDPVTLYKKAEYDPNTDRILEYAGSKDNEYYVTPNTPQGVDFERRLPEFEIIENTGLYDPNAVGPTAPKFIPSETGPTLNPNWRSGDALERVALEELLLPASLPFKATTKLGKAALFGAELANPLSGLRSSSIKNVGAFENMPKPTKEALEDAKGFLRRREFVKNLQKEKLVGKEFEDLNYAARSTDRTNALTKLALDRDATRFRGVKGSVPKNGIIEQELSGFPLDMSKPASGQYISEFDNMKAAGVDFKDPISIAKYQASHIPMQEYGYRSGMPSMRYVDALYTTKEPPLSSPFGYGNYSIKMSSPRDYSTGNYQDWFNKYHNVKDRNFHKLALNDGYYNSSWAPDTPYELPVLLDNSSVVGIKGTKMFDVDSSYPFMDYKRLNSEQQRQYNDFIKKHKEDYDTGWKGQYKKGGHINPYMYYAGGPMQYKRGGLLKDIGLGVADFALSTIGGVTGIQSMKDIVNEKQYSNDKFDAGANFAGSIGSTALKLIPVTAPIANAAGIVGGAANKAFGIDAANYNPNQEVSDLEKAGNIVGQAGNVASMFMGNTSGVSADAGKFMQGVDKINKFGQSPTGQLLNQGLSFEQGGNINNNSVNLQNSTMKRYKDYKTKYKQGGIIQDKLEANNIYEMPSYVGEHWQHPDGGAPMGPNASVEAKELVRMEQGGRTGVNTPTYVDPATVNGTNSIMMPQMTSDNKMITDKNGMPKFSNKSPAQWLKEKLNRGSEFRVQVDRFSEPSNQQVMDIAEGGREVAVSVNELKQQAAQEDAMRIAMADNVAAYGGYLSKYRNLNMPKSKAKGGLTDPPDKWSLPIASRSNVQQGSRNILNNNLADTEFGSRIINEYDNGLPNDTSYTWIKNINRGGNPDTESFFYNTGQNQPDGKPFINYQGSNPNPNINDYLPKIQGLSRYAVGGPLYGNTDSEYTYAHGGPVVSNINQDFDLYAQNRGGMMMANGGMMMPQDDGMSKQIAADLQQGAKPEDILSQLIESGMDPQQAQAMLQAIMGNIKPQAPMMAMGGRTMYAEGDDIPQYAGQLGKESWLTTAAGIGQVIPDVAAGIMSARALKKKDYEVKPFTVEGPKFNAEPIAIGMRGETASNKALMADTLRNSGMTAAGLRGSLAGYYGDQSKALGKGLTDLYTQKYNIEGQGQFQADMFNAKARADAATATMQGKEGYMQDILTAGQGMTNKLANYYANRQKAGMQQWQAENTKSPYYSFTTVDGKTMVAFLNPKDGNYYDNSGNIIKSSGE